MSTYKVVLVILFLYHDDECVKRNRSVVFH